MSGSLSRSYFSDKWKAYLEYRGLTDGQSDATFTQEDGSVEFRDKLYKSWSYSGWAGASGHDAPMIAWVEHCSFTHRGLVPPYGERNLGQHWLR